MRANHFIHFTRIHLRRSNKNKQTTNRSKKSQDTRRKIILRSDRTRDRTGMSIQSIQKMGSSAEKTTPASATKDADEELITEWDVDVFHEFDHSLLNVFENNKKKYRPKFTIINCDAYKRRYPMIYKHRKREDFVHFLNCIEAFGAKTNSLSSAEHTTSIPIIFRSLDAQLNIDIVRSWKRNEQSNDRLPRDVFSEEYILEILKTGKLTDLNQFRVAESDFHPYDANKLISGTCSWNILRRLR